MRQYVVDRSTSRVPPLIVPLEDIPPIGLLCCPGAEVAVVDEPPTGSSWPETRTDGIISNSGSHLHKHRKKVKKGEIKSKFK